MSNAFEEFKKERLRKQRNEARIRFRDRHNVKQFHVELPHERLELLETKLKEKRMSKKQFLENAIDKFLKE